MRSGDPGSGAPGHHSELSEILKGAWALRGPTGCPDCCLPHPPQPQGRQGVLPLPVWGRGCPGKIIRTQGGGPGSYGLLDGGLLAVGLEQRGGAAGQHGPLISAELGPAVLKPDLGVGRCVERGAAAAREPKSFRKRCGPALPPASGWRLRLSEPQFPPL